MASIYTVSSVKSIVTDSSSADFAFFSHLDHLQLPSARNVPYFSRI